MPQKPAHTLHSMDSVMAMVSVGSEICFTGSNAQGHQERPPSYREMQEHVVEDMVARSMKPSAWKNDPRALPSVQQNRDKLRGREEFDIKSMRSEHEVTSEARRNNTSVHVLDLCPMCQERIQTLS